MSFFLNRVIAAEVDVRYNISSSSVPVKHGQGVTILTKSTPIADVCALSACRFASSDDIFHQVQNGLRCFWDHHPLPDGEPGLSCPIEYLPARSRANVGHYILTFCSTEYEKNYSAGESIAPASFITYGTFCDWPCMLSYIREHKKYDKRFEYSELLLPKYATIHEEIEPAPHWTLLDTYGGPLSILQFRSGFKKTKFTYNGHVCQSFIAAYKLTST